MSHINITIEGNLNRLVLSNPPQNRLAQEFFDELRDAISLRCGDDLSRENIVKQSPSIAYDFE